MKRTIAVWFAPLLALTAPAVAQNGNTDTTTIDILRLDSTNPDGDPVVHEFRGPFISGSTLSGGSGRTAAAPFVFTGSLPEADGHSSAVFTPDGTKVIVANRDSRNLVIFDIATRALISEIPLSGDPQSVAITPDGAKAVTANLHTATASIVDIASATETAVLAVGTYPSVARITPNGLLAVVSNSGSQTVSVVDIASATVVRTIVVGTVQMTLSVNPETAALGFRAGGPELADSTTMIFPDYSGNRIQFVDITTGTVTNVPCDPVPTSIAIGGNTAVVTHYLSTRKMTVLDIPSRTITKTIAFSADLQGPVAINPAGTRAVVAVLNACRMVDIASSSVTGDLSTASVSEIHTTYDGQYALCTGFFGSLISYSSQTVVTNLNNFVSAPIGALSPVSHRAALFSDTFGEDMVILDTNGASGSLLSAGPSGPAPESDSCRTSAITDDGSTLVAVAQRSQTATIIHPRSRAILAIANAGRRTGGVEVTPNGSKAVIANRDGSTATIVNLSTFAVTDVPISTRADEVEISPDSQFAYLAVVASGDGVWRINLNTNTVQGAKLLTGDMGSAGYAYQQFSGMKLSPNGAALVTCNSFTANISIIDTAAWSVVKTVAVGSAPTRAAFSPDNSRIYVANRDSDNISVVSNAGAASALIGTIPVGDGPFDMMVSPDGSRLYVINFNASTIGVVNTVTLSQIAAIPIATNVSVTGLRLSPDGSRLYVAFGQASITFGAGGYFQSESGAVRVIDTATNTTLQTINVGHAPSMLSLNALTGAVGAAPQTWGDGVTIIEPCGADFNYDGFLDPLDYNPFINAFESADPSADYNGDGFIDPLDYNTFINDFESGC